MAQEFIGVVLSLTERKGTSQRGEWKMWEVVLQHESGQYPRKVLVSVWDEEVFNTIAICKGNVTPVKVVCNVDAREYNGRWFNDIRVWRAEAVGQTQVVTNIVTPIQPTPQQVPSNAGGQVGGNANNDPLPF